MRVSFLPQPDGGTIALDDMLGAHEGRFFLASGGVSYSHPSDTRIWHAGKSEAAFRQAAEAWNAAAEAGPSGTDELCSRLERAGVLTGTEDSYWDLLLEQARDHLL